MVIAFLKPGQAFKVLGVLIIFGVNPLLTQLFDNFFAEGTKLLEGIISDFRQFGVPGADKGEERVFVAFPQFVKGVHQPLNVKVGVLKLALDAITVDNR